LGDHFGSVVVNVVFIISVLGLRALMIWNKYPEMLYELPVFSPSYYGTSSLFPSLGDFFLNALIVCTLAHYVQKKNAKVLSEESLWRTGLEIVKLTVLLLISIPLLILIEGLVENSSISYNINNLFELNYMSFIGLISIGLFLFSYYFMAETAMKRLESLKGKTIVLTWIVAYAAFVIICLVLSYTDSALMIWPPVFVIVVLFKNFKGNTSSSELLAESSRLYPSITLIIIAAIFAAHSISHSYAHKEIEERKILAQKLAVETDPVAEYMYDELEKSLIDDPTIQKGTSKLEENKETILEHIHDKHLRGFWEKYDVQITICQSGDSLILQNDNLIVPCLGFFKDMVKSQGGRTLAENFYYLDNNNGRVSYIGLLELDSIAIILEFDSKIIPEELGFPELLLDLEVSEHLRDALKYYSYAKFKNNKLSSQSGEFPFSGKLTDQIYDGEYAVVNTEGYNHLFYKVDASTTIILSRKEDQPLDPVFRFSYLFALFCLMALAFGGFSELSINKFAFRLSFRKRIELSMILVLLISLIPIAFGTKYYIEQQYQTRNDQNIREKIQSVLIEVEHKLANEQKLTGELQEYVAYLLQKFSFVFFTDINLYDLDGTLIASSRPKMFKEGLIGKKMNTDAYAALAVNAKSEFIHQEKIGELSFLSAYALFRNQDQEVLAYLNLPYFAKKDDVKKEVSTFFVALFNIYVVLILIAVLIALIISNRITQPLRLIQEKLSKVKIGTANEPIDWKSEDEIGKLVDEYNRMISELETSAKLLARSERESAWREMAKQVAHEIKNPLTPMKLSVQHLQRAWKDENVDWEKKLEQFTQTLVQQIDALSNIANEFSNFAKMPKTKSEVVNLQEIVENAVELFRESGQVEISLETKIGEEVDALLILADKEQLNQILNNLIKNGIQAMTEPKSGKIDVRITEKDGDYVVEIEDNGSGIKEEEYDKIFAPNFTTKTGGMGLGLALVKNMIENAGGAVWFESIEGDGSSFFFSLPKHSV
ncbi:MAG: GHKL domain-containing protein, partial [Flavobacteriales bacterium]|nr:GHKL domain-containing protein [Flavobacteriales bacterium]